ncbi:6-phosphogluconolactonase/Glucosamine-6-phosphat e isomerase/deaminase [Fasciolopsis buskii]|uniref:6-phosphogluconolactonase n=1 Tax=Fasciolopsis buskii TaxID=27845 RepID=A0A8E0VJF7_9TREM|nr:6-phosphogluconolactonase/Glucosamine-6-phosphat e isomerase/deaminase [Fasciolopsis buski]
MEFVVSETYDQLCHKICDAICTALRKATAQNRKCSVGVSGGSMPQMISGICAHLELPWNLVHFFYCDERMVPVTDPESTHRVYCELIYPNIPIPQENIHPVKTELPAHEAAKDYHEQLMNFFGASNGYPAFDLLLLGIGPDGHTCSLFPGHPLLHCEDRSVAAIEDSPKPPPQRVTLTLPVLNKAKRVYFLVSGSNKSNAVAEVFSSKESPSRLPCALVQPIDGELVWYLDKSAASKITG